MTDVLPQSPRVCPQCGYSHLGASRAHTTGERLRAWWTRTRWFRCDTCQWRGCLRDEWRPDEAFPDLPPLRLGRDLDIDPLQQRDEDALVGLVLEQRDTLRGQIRLWLDDSRPAPGGWLRVTTVRNAKRLIETGLVRELSLDYDLGWCATCIAAGEHLKASGRRHCEHTPTGYDLVTWMAETGHWSLTLPTVHSGNVDGGARMLGAIARYWHGSESGAPAEEVAGAAQTAASTGLPPAVASATVSTLSRCPRCQGTYLFRTHRHSGAERLRSMLTRRYPVRCHACEHVFWSKDPILVRMTGPADATPVVIENSRFEDLDPD